MSIGFRDVLHGAALAAFALVLTGCATVSQKVAWIQDGTPMGAIWKRRTDCGTEWEYVDEAGSLQRIERRDRSGTLLPGPSVTTYLYDSRGKLAEERHCDARLLPVPCAAGYVIKHYAYSVKPEGGRVVEHSFLDKERKSVCTISGYAFVRLFYDGAGGRAESVVLEDHRREPASALWDGVYGVARVGYKELRGVGAIRCGAYYGPHGEVVARKRVDGSCYVSTTSISVVDRDQIRTTTIVRTK
jgi:hypothetical protein